MVKIFENLNLTNSRLEIDSYGNKYWFNFINQLHRENGPAFIHQNGYKEWKIKGRLHRIDGPSRIWIKNNKEWYIDNIFIRCFEYD